MALTLTQPEPEGEGERPPLPPDPRKPMLIKVSQLVINDEAQRLIEGGAVQKVEREWDWRLAEAASVVPIGDGRYHVVEGQTRVTGLRRRDPTASLWCMVGPAEWLGDNLEADQALLISTGRRVHDQFAKWCMRAIRGDRHEVLADRMLLEQHGLQLSRHKSAMTIAAVAAVSTLIKARKQTPEEGCDVLDRTVTVLLAAWPHHDAESRISRFDHRLIYAVGEILARNPDADLSRFATALRRQKSAQRWIDDAVVSAADQSRSEVLVGHLIAAYNRNLRRNRWLAW